MVATADIQRRKKLAAHERTEAEQEARADEGGERRTRSRPGCAGDDDERGDGEQRQRVCDRAVDDPLGQKLRLVGPCQQNRNVCNVVGGKEVRRAAVRHREVERDRQKGERKEEHCLLNAEHQRIVEDEPVREEASYEGDRAEKRVVADAAKGECGALRDAKLGARDLDERLDPVRGRGHDRFRLVNAPPRTGGGERGNPAAGRGPRAP